MSKHYTLNLELGHIFAYMAHHFILLRLSPFGLRFDREGWWFEHLRYSCSFGCRQKVLETFPGPGYPHSEDGVVFGIYWQICIY